MKLDVGCGANPKGDVNVDLFIKTTLHRTKNHVINPKLIPNFVRCSANHLPFRNKVFDDSISCHVLEHKGIVTMLMIKEMVRVTRKSVEIVVPHRFNDRKHHPAHARQFSKSSMESLLRKMGLLFQVDVTYRYFPHIFFHLVSLPHELHIKIKPLELV